MQSRVSRPSACLMTFRQLRRLGFERREAGVEHGVQQVGLLDSGSADDLAELQAAQAARQRRRPRQGGNGRGPGQPACADVSGPDGPCRGRCRLPRPGAVHLAGQRDLDLPRTGRRGRPAPRASGWAPPTTSSAAAATRWRPSCTPSTTRSARPASPTGTPRSSATRWPAPPVRPGICDRVSVILLRR